MWIRKTDKELKIKPRKSFAVGLDKYFENPNFIVIFIFFLFFLVFVYKYLGSGYKMHYLPPLSWKELVDYLPTIGFEAFAFSLVVYIVVKFWIKKPKSYKNPVVCDSCNIIKDLDAENHCPCGGNFISMDEMKCIDDDK